MNNHSNCPNCLRSWSNIICDLFETTGFRDQFNLPENFNNYKDTFCHLFNKPLNELNNNNRIDQYINQYERVYYDDKCVHTNREWENVR
jgi:hypothetical protein